MRVLSLSACLLLYCTAGAQWLPWAKGNTYRNDNNPLYWKNKKPYEGYWQQDVYYQIKAKLDDVEETVTGEEVLVYYNNSPNTLDKAYFHLYQNANQPGSLVDNLYTGNKIAHTFGKYESQKLGTTIQSFSVNGASVAFHINYTVLECMLPQGLKPGDSCVFRIGFKTYFDSGSIRRRMKVMHHDGVSHFDGVHWYPRICVYDRKFTWETAQHMEHEFYGDYGAYDVELQLPNHYVNEATGVLQNPDEAYPNNLRDRLDIKNFTVPLKPTERVSVITNPDGTWKSWKYHADNVHDFAWTADPTYRIGEIQWQGISCIALVQERNAPYWQQTDSFVAFVIGTYSKDFGMYEYPKMVAADAADGMEYPMLTLDGGRYPSHRDLIAHEVGHNWFFGMVGNNETYRASLDEGFTQFITTWCMRKATGKFNAPSDIEYARGYAGYIYDAMDGTEDLPINTHSDDFNNGIRHGGGYGHVYSKTATMLYNLQYVLGDSVFKKAMQNYVQQWKMCHPYVEDFRNSIIMSAKSDLNWFFDQWFETTKYCDYGIKRVKRQSDGSYIITLKRSGDMVMPVDLRLSLGDGTKWNVTVPVSNYRKPGTFSAKDPWLGVGFLRRTYDLKINVQSRIKAVELDPSYRLADINRMDNFWHRVVGISFDKENGLENDYRTGYNLRWRPDAWYAYVDGLRVGFKLSGDYAARKHVFNLYVWGQSGNGRVVANNTGNLNYHFDYKNALRKRGEIVLGSRYISSVWTHKAGWEKNVGKGGRVFTYFKYLERIKTPESYLINPPINEQFYGYIPTQNLWSSGMNISFNIGYLKNYTAYNRSGNWQLMLRSSTPFSDASYGYFRFSWINSLGLGKKMNLKTRIFGHAGSGTVSPAESMLYAAGANPEEIQDNKIVRDFITYPIVPNNAYNSSIMLGGGLNLRGYNNYSLPKKVNDTVRTFYRGSSGAAVNAELELTKLFEFMPKSNYVGVQFYLFGDAGVLGYQHHANFINSGVVADAGAGFLFQVKSWRVNYKYKKEKKQAMAGLKPLQIRLDMPLFLSAVQAGQENMAFRWVLGVNRAF